MNLDISERNFEEVVEASLLRGGPDAMAVAGMVAEPEAPYGLYAAGGYVKRSYKDYDRSLCLDTEMLVRFAQASQPKEWDRLKSHYGDEVRERFAKRVASEVEKRGLIDVLRKGVKDAGVKFEMYHPRPPSTLNPDLQTLYEANLFSVIRQLRYSTSNENSIDVVLFLNGLPIFTSELKNPFNGQDVNNAVHQYCYDRDPREPLLSFGRVIAHFAVDPELAFVTTKLEGPKTHFLPFNQGYDNGAGNRPTKTGFATQYLWDHVWSKDSVLELVQRFVHVLEEEDDKGRKTGKKSLIFPRYHQLDAVRRLVLDALQNGAGPDYLIQHSAGSGKSNTIAWLAHQLSTLHDASDERVFDSIIVITDRRVLDRQLQRTIRQFEQTLGVVENIDKTSRQLKEALESGKTIIVTTLQKFPMIVKEIGELPGKQFALIIDEAHSSQTGETSRMMHQVLKVDSLEEAEEQDQVEEDLEDRIVKVAEGRGRLDNVSMFAFTATPKEKTLQMFGEEREDGSYEPFSLYSMKQAIEEGFILDVLRNYTTYRVYWNLLKKIEDDPRYNERKAKYLARLFVDLHPHAIDEKVAIMAEHFAQNSAPEIGGRAKAMVVTRSRLHAVKTFLSLRRYLEEHGHPFKALVAFSGEVDDGGIKYTETGLNGFSEKQTALVFKQPEYRFLVVAEKFQTGFDEPLLHTMYVDKKLSGLNAVQTLSRLNRIHRDKTETMVLDFVNEADDIQSAFARYYEASILSEGADPHLLYDLQRTLLDSEVFDEDEVRAFAEVFFDPKGSQDRLYQVLREPERRYKDLAEEDQAAFRKEITSFTRMYAFLSQVATFVDADLESLYHFARYLLRRLPTEQKGLPYEVQQAIDLESFSVRETFGGSIALGADKGRLEPPGKGVDVEPSPEEKEALSQIIDELNERFGTSFTAEDKVFVEELENRLVDHAGLEASIRANTPENARLTFDHVIEDLLQDMVDKNFELYKRVTDDERFGDFFKDELYKRYRKQVESSPPGPRVPSIVDAVVDALVKELAPEKVILFGSGARGELIEGSDLDLLVVLPEVSEDRSEVTRAYRAVGTVKGRPPVDVLVFSSQDVAEWGDVVGHIINEALVDGRVVYDAA
ncbi:MAG: DEAD/DEAH box helicase [Actinobacteria bacterium]|nr:DEAD/DEAH box helicase [Actinomycetota bacterium]